jgi:aspartyl-tRNA(Asn)/glutamyl-tRNA(Gln) amidotransferase subunit A
MSEDWRRLDACALGAAYRAGTLDPREIAADLSARIARLNPALNAYCALNPDLGREAAESAARFAAGAARGPLEGVPVIVKDNLAVAGMPATWGNRAFAARPPARDELPVARLRAAGALFAGKGNTPEFAVEGYTGNALFGVTGNPFDPALTPGGSSGGVVAAVAAGLATAGIGTDGGGSIRRPAAYAGLVGFKPGIGHAPRAGGLPQVLMDFEVVGPLARSARDAALIDAILRGADRADPRSRARAAPAAFADAPRVLYARTLGDAPCDPDILAQVDASAARLAALGCAVTRGDLPLDLGPLNRVWGRIAQIGLARLFATDPEVAAAASPKYRAMAATDATADELLDILGEVAALRRAASLLFADWDIVMTPACAAMPWPAAQTHPTRIAGREVGLRGHAVYTGWVNAAGHPAIALPARPAPSGLPIGFQLVGDLGSEAALLALGERWEAAEGGFRWPAEPAP